MPIKNYEVGEDVFRANGERVQIMAMLEDGDVVICPYYDDDDDCDYLDTDSKSIINAKNLFQDPPVVQHHETIQRLNKDIRELEGKKEDLRREVYEFEKLVRDQKRDLTIAKSSDRVVKQILDFAEGKITHITVATSRSKSIGKNKRNGYYYHEVQVMTVPDFFNVFKETHKRVRDGIPIFCVKGMNTGTNNILCLPEIAIWDEYGCTKKEIFLATSYDEALGRAKTLIQERFDFFFEFIMGEDDYINALNFLHVSVDDAIALDIAIPNWLMLLHNLGKQKELWSTMDSYSNRRTKLDEDMRQEQEKINEVEANISFLLDMKDTDLDPRFQETLELLEKSNKEKES